MSLCGAYLYTASHRTSVGHINEYGTVLTKLKASHIPVFGEMKNLIMFSIMYTRGYIDSIRNTYTNDLSTFSSNHSPTYHSILPSPT